MVLLIPHFVIQMNKFSKHVLGEEDLRCYY